MKIKIALVEDNKVLRETLEAFLNRYENFECIFSLPNPLLLLPSMRENKPDVILMDIEMPEMDGYVLTKLIKSDHRFNGIPVIMHSSLSSNANRAMGTSVGVDAYVAKFDPAILADTLIPFLQR